MLTERLGMTADEFGRVTGWDIKPEGACRDDVCVPLAPGDFDAAATADRLGMAVVSEPGLDVVALGPATLGGRSLSSVDASAFHLPDLDGRTFSLSSLAGEKVVLVAWAPY
jgi:hypothetical protein